MAGIILAILIFGYTGFIIVRKARAVKAGKSCHGGCGMCPYKEKCSQ